MEDEYYLSFIKNTHFLKDVSKKMYVRKIELIQKIDNRSIHDIIFNIDEFMNIFDSMKGKLEQTVGLHTKYSYISAIFALFFYNNELKENNVILYKQWERLRKDIQTTIQSQYKSNAPTPRQEIAYVDYLEVITKRDSLPISFERLLLFMYTAIPPVRNNYHNMKIYREDVDLNTTNYIVLHDDDQLESYIVLNDFKTSKYFDKNIIFVPDILKQEILDSLTWLPREFLFVSPRTKLPYINSNTFNKWANIKL
jgi:hypothetical protein